MTLDTQATDQTSIEREIRTAPTLRALCRALNRIELRRPFGILISELPRYSDEEPPAHVNAWSWDEWHYLLYEDGRWCLGTRSIYDAVILDD